MTINSVNFIKMLHRRKMITEATMADLKVSTDSGRVSRGKKLTYFFKEVNRDDKRGRKVG